MIPGMSTGILDPLHPLSLQGSLQPPITPPLNLGMARQRCRDFEERGFCLRGDMCPMEHGVNRIVVEDVQVCHLLLLADKILCCFYANLNHLSYV